MANCRTVGLLVVGYALDVVVVDALTDHVKIITTK